MKKHTHFLEWDEHSRDETLALSEEDSRRYLRDLRHILAELVFIENEINKIRIPFLYYKYRHSDGEISLMLDVNINIVNGWRNRQGLSAIRKEKLHVVNIRKRIHEVVIDKFNKVELSERWGISYQQVNKFINIYEETINAERKELRIVNKNK